MATHKIMHMNGLRPGMVCGKRIHCPCIEGCKFESRFDTNYQFFASNSECLVCVRLLAGWLLIPLAGQIVRLFPPAFVQQRSTHDSGACSGSARTLSCDPPVLAIVSPRYAPRLSRPSHTIHRRSPWCPSPWPWPPRCFRN